MGFIAVGERTIVECLDVVDFRIGQQRTDQAGDKAGVEIRDVAVDVTEDVAVGNVQGLPQVFAFADVGAFPRLDFGREVDGCSGGFGDFTRGILGSGIDDQDFIDQAGRFDQ